MARFRRATIRGLRANWLSLSVLVIVFAVTAAGVRPITTTDPAQAEQQAVAAPAARQTAAVSGDDGLSLPALFGGIVLAFAVGLTAGHVQRRRRAARRDAARLRPDPVPDPPVARAAPVVPPPEPPAPKPRPKVVEPQPPPPPPPPPPPTREEPGPAAEEPEREAPKAKPRSRRGRGTTKRPKPKAEAPFEPPLTAREGPGPAASGGPVPERPPEAPRAGRPRSDRYGREASLDAPEAVAPGRPAAEPAPMQLFTRDRPWPEEAASVWTCEIVWKAGYVKSTFRAMAGPPGGEGRRKPIGESAPLRWTLMSDPEPPTPEMVAGVKSLISALIAAGWEPTEPGVAWYAQRFLWRGEGEPGDVDAPEPAPAAEPPPR